MLFTWYMMYGSIKYMSNKNFRLLRYFLLISGIYLIFYSYVKLSESKLQFSYYVDGVIAGLVILFVIGAYGAITYFIFREIWKHKSIYKCVYITLFLISAGLLLYFLVPTVFVFLGYIQYHYFS
jgi:hypothetical protein